MYLYKLPAAIVLVPLFRWWLSMRYGCVERIFRCRTLLWTEKIWMNLRNIKSVLGKKGPELYWSIVFVLLFGLYSTIIEPGLGTCVISGHPYVHLALAGLAWRITTWTDLYTDRDISLPSLIKASVVMPRMRLQCCSLHVYNNLNASRKIPSSFLQYPF